VLVLYKVFLKFPDALRPAFPRLKEKLEDPDPGESFRTRACCFRWNWFHGTYRGAHWLYCSGADWVHRIRAKMNSVCGIRGILINGRTMLDPSRSLVPADLRRTSVMLRRPDPDACCR